MGKALLKKRWVGIAVATWMVVLFLGICPYLCPSAQAEEVVPPCHKEAESTVPSDKESHVCCREEFSSYLPSSNFDETTSSPTTILWAISDLPVGQADQEAQGVLSSERAPPLFTTSVTNKVTLNL